MSEKMEKYPQIVLGTDNVYQLFIAPDVEIKFDSQESIEDFCKDKNFIIKGEFISHQRDRKQKSMRELCHILSQLD